MTAWPRQPDDHTCGPSCVVVAERLRDGLPPSPSQGFGHLVRARHRELNHWWPRALGTTPWAVRRALGGRVRPYRREAVLAALPRPVPVYLGSRWLPRHVVLVLGERDGEPTAYDPARGVVAPLSTSRWRRPWFAVLPDRDDLR